MHHLFVAESTKNQDIFGVGRNERVKLLAVKEMLPVLMESGFNKILYISLDTNEKQVLYEQANKEPVKKIYRFFYTNQLTHPEMIAILALSGDLVGITGDQSLGEALSAKKLIVYECLSHKRKLVEGLIRFFEVASKNHNTKKLVELLIKINIDDPRDNKKNVLKKLLSDPAVLSNYQVICQRIHQDFDLLKPIKSSIEPIISHIVAQNTKLGQTTLVLLGLKAQQITRYREILKNNSNNPQKILKISRKDKRLLSHNLPFSVLKYPENEGFYLLTSGEGSVLGQGGWGKVKLGHYCDSRGVVSQHALAIKVEKVVANSISEVGLFKAAYPRQGDYFYRQGVALENKKNYSIFPKLPGISLEAYLTNNPDLPMQERLLVSLAVLESVLELHQKKIAHLDLKPRNILYDSGNLERRRRAYLIDFGYATRFGEISQHDDVGMLDYMPPEFFERDCIIDEALDIYSCAPLLAQSLGIPYHLLMGIKLRESLKVIKNESIRSVIENTFTQERSIGEAFYRLPPRCRLDEGFTEFVQIFNTGKFDFNYIGTDAQADKISSILNKMANNDPKSRLSLVAVAISLAKIVESLDNNSSGIMYPSR